MTVKSNFPEIRPSLNLDFANVKALDPRITFTRTTTATYYDGKTVAKAEENLLLYSQEFDNAAWSKNAITVTANSDTAPDGTTTAELFAETATTALHYLQGGTTIRFNAVSGQSYVFSFFLKKGSGATAPDIMQLSWGVGGFASDVYANFNLDTGVVSSSGAGATATIASAGNGWYRCSLVATASATASSTTALFFCDNNGSATRAPSYLGATTADVLVWGAQLEQRSAVSAYTPTTTQAITNYVPVLQTAASGVARFDHNPTTGESLGLLVEEQRTNLYTYSAEFDNAAWTKVQATITSNTIIAPDGTLTGDKLIVDNAQTAGYVAQAKSLTSGTSYTATCYVKAGEVSDFRFVFESAAFGSNLNAIFNLSTGTVTSFTVSSASIQSVGNGWYRCIATAAATSTASAGVQMRSAYTGNGFDGIYLWGAQLEEGAFPTSYIPTTSATVTRNADAASMTGTNFSSWYRADEGTLYSESQTNQANAANVPRRIFISDGTTSNNINLNNGASGFQGGVSVNGTLQASFAVGSYSSSSTKQSVAYKVNDFNYATNGTASTADTSGTLPVVNQVNIGSAPSANFLNGTIKKLAFYPSRLSDAQLAALTTV